MLGPEAIAYAKDLVASLVGARCVWMDADKTMGILSSRVRSYKTMIFLQSERDATAREVRSEAWLPRAATDKYLNNHMINGKRCAVEAESWKAPLLRVAGDITSWRARCRRSPLKLRREFTRGTRLFCVAEGQRPIFLASYSTGSGWHLDAESFAMLQLEWTWNRAGPEWPAAARRCRDADRWAPREPKSRLRVWCRGTSEGRVVPVPRAL